MKRIYTFLFVTMVMLMLSVSSAWAQYVKLTAEDGTISWIEIEGTIDGTNFEIYKGDYESAINNKTKGSIDLNEVWSECGGIGTPYQVTSIGDYAFRSCSGLTSIVIPSSVTSIGEYAFYVCRGLTTVVIPSSVTSIGDYAFRSCSGLTSIVIPSSVTSIGNGAFNGTAWYNNQPDGLVYAGKVAYKYKGTMPENTIITLIEGTKSIGQEAFSGCSGLTSIVIPSSVTSIGNYAFEDCRGLTSVEIPSSVTSIGSGAFNRCSSLTSVVIPSSVTSIGNYAFYNCSGLTSIDIPSSVTSIGDGAFYNCSDLTSIDIPSSVTSIGNQAFRGCSGLTSVVIPSSVTNIGSSAFYNCSGLTSVEIPSSVTSIGSSAFYNCSGLTSVEIPFSVTSIGSSAFYNCSGLTSVVIPSSVTSIGDFTFLGCSGLISVEIPSGVTIIGNSAFSGTAWYNNQPNGLIYAGKVAYKYKGTMPENTIITLIEGTKSIGYQAFYDCRGLISVVIPSSVTSIGQYAFSGCSGMTSIISYIADVYKTGTDAFSGCENATLYVPKGLKATYWSIADWNRFNKIEEMPEVIPGAFVMSCNNKGKVMINGGVQFTNDVGEVSVYDGMDNTFVFIPEENCQLEQVLIDGLDVTLSVKNNQLTTKIRENSKMIVTFSKAGDMNNDGNIDISDVVSLVNMILGQ